MSWDALPKPTLESSQVSKKVAEYAKLHDYGEEAERKRKQNYAEQTNAYYDLATDFYERGWGDCFHFAPRHNFETMSESLRRHEYYIALRLNLKKGIEALDIGCGIGGPMRNIARFSGANIVGVNNNAYQISRLKLLNEAAGLDKLCKAIKGNFMSLPFNDNSIDTAYQIEATAHAPSKVEVYKEIFRVLKPGALFGGYEWVLTDKFDGNNNEHVRLRRELERGSGIPSLPMAREIIPALEEAGFEIVDCEDMAPHGDITWYEGLAPVWTKTNWQLTATGKTVIYYTVKMLEMARVLPSGTTQVQSILQSGGEALYLCGKEGIFSPSYFHLARKPNK